MQMARIYIKKKLPEIGHKVKAEINLQNQTLQLKPLLFQH